MAKVWKGSFALLAVFLLGRSCEAIGAILPQPDPGMPQTLKTLTLEQLGNVEVTTQSKEPTEVWNTAAAVYVLTNEDIRRSGVTNVPDALRLVPGVNVARVSGSRNWAVGIRGFGDQFSKYVLVLIDGRSVYTPLFGGVLWTIDNVMLEDIDRIEVIRGPGGTIWGADAVNGVINIITKSAADTKGALASVGGGNIDHGTVDARYGTQAHGVDYRAYAFGFFRGPEDHQQGQPKYDWSRDGQAGARADWKLRHDQLTLQGDMYLGRFGDAQNIGTYVPAAIFVSYAPTNADGGNILGRWRRSFENNSDLYLQTYWAHDRRLGSNFGETRDTFDMDFLHRTPQLRFQRFTYGVGVRLSPSTVRQVDVTDTFNPASKTDSVYSGFLEDAIQFVPEKLSLTLGSKLESNNYTGFEYQPNGRLLWTPTGVQSFWASISRAVRTPDRVDEDIRVDLLAVDNPLIFAEVLGNHNLRAERLTAYEAGYRALLNPKFFIAIAGFHNEYRDLIAQGAPAIGAGAVPPFPPGALLFSVQYRNGIKGSVDGFEISPDWKPFSWWQMKSSYSYLHKHLLDQSGFSDTATLTSLHGSSPSSQLVLRSVMDLGSRFEFDPTFRYVGKLPAQNVAAYKTVDVHLGCHARKDLEVSINGENLLQPHHAEFGVDPSPAVLIKRSIYAKLVWTK